MIWVYIILALIFISLVYFLFAPFFIEANSEKNLLRFRFHKIASGRMFLGDSFFLEIKVLGWRKTIDLLEPRQKKSKQLNKSTKEKKKRSIITFKKSIAVLRSFKLNKFEVNIDTGDNYTNGILYPALLFAGYSIHKTVSVNFTGESKFILEIENNAARILWNFLKS